MKYLEQFANLPTHTQIISLLIVIGLFLALGFIIDRFIPSGEVKALKQANKHKSKQVKTIESVYRKRA